MYLFLQVVHILSALFMVLVVLLQNGNSGGVGAAFGGGNSQGVFGASGATSVLGKATYVAATIFMLTSLGLTIEQSREGRVGLEEKIESVE